LQTVITLLKETGKLPAQYKPHKLSGNYAGLWECHIKPDWLLVWLQDDNKLTLILTNTGTHSDLF
jgi:mRNA interferase YafQ